VGGQDEQTDDVLDQHLLLGPEAASEPGLYDADLLDGQFEKRCHHPAHMERHLGR